MSILTCPYCMSPIGPEENVVECRSCGAAHHRECWDENRGCCVRDCKEVSRSLDIDLPEDRDKKLVLTRESVEAAASHKPSRLNNPCLRCGRQVPEGELHCAECIPAREESQDTRNAGPILAMLGVVAVLLAWLVIVSISSPQPKPEATRTQQGSRIGQ